MMTVRYSPKKHGNKVEQSDLYSVEGVNATSCQLMFLVISLHFPVITNEPVGKLKIIVPQHMSI